MFLFGALSTQAQNKKKIAVLDLDAVNMIYDGSEMARLLRMEVTKIDVGMVVDRYEMSEQFKEKAFESSNCFSTKCAAEAGNILGADQSLVGTMERFGEKIIVTLRLINCGSGEIENQVVTEYINRQEEIQRMLRISAQKLFKGESEDQLTSELEHVDVPVKNDNALIRLNGPRMGLSMTTGESGERLIDDTKYGGYDMMGSPKIGALTSQMGYQWEKRYIASNDFQALVEVIGLVGGMESGKFIPSLTLLNGFRWGQRNWEVGFGPTFRFVQTSLGFYDSEGNWRREGEIPNINGEFEVIERLDSRGNLKGNMGMLFGVGRTFQSGRLNIPVNVYLSPRKSGSIVGFSVGFNIQKLKQ